MAEEVLVFGRQERVDHPLGHGADGNEHPAFDGEFGQQPSVAGLHPGHHRRFVVGQLPVVGQPPPVLVEDVDTAAGARENDDQQKADNGDKRLKHVRLIQRGNLRRRSGPSSSNVRPGAMARRRELTWNCGGFVAQFGTSLLNAPPVRSARNSGRWPGRPNRRSAPGSLSGGAPAHPGGWTGNPSQSAPRGHRAP